MAAATDAPAAPTKWKPTPDEQADLDAMNVAIARMQKHTPKDPYVLEIPQDVEPRYHHHSASRHQWLHNTPFVEGEHEITQYQTYHYYEHGKEMYVLHNSRREERASGSTRPAATAKASSAAPKKKISLDAYKKQKSGAISTPELKATKASDAPAKQPAVKGPIERVKAESEDILAAVAEEDVPVVKQSDAGAPLNDLKRKREDGAVMKTVEHTQEARVENAEPSAKKPKLSGERVIKTKSDQSGSRLARANQEKVGKSPHAPEENGLPPRMISPEYPPALPPRLSPGIQDKRDSSEPDETSLPKRITPNMPENIAKSLQAREKPMTTSIPGSASKEKAGRQSPIRKEASGVTKHKSPTSRNGFRAGSRSPTRSAMEDRGRPSSSLAKRENIGLSQDDEIAVGKALKSKKAMSMQAADQQKVSLVLKLKYKRARAGDIARILKMRPRPDKRMLASPPGSVQDEGPPPRPPEKKNVERKEATATKGVAQKIGPAQKQERRAAALQAEKDRLTSTAKSVAMEKQASADKRSVQDRNTEKRQAADDEKRESPTKRKQAESEARKEIKTPVPRDPDSPAGSKQLQATPTARNNLLAAHMARDKSQDSNTQTPPATSSTPNITSQPNGHARPPSSQPTSKTARQQALESEQRRLDTLGRELKHAASAHLQSSGSVVPPAELRLAAVKAVESFLCYLLAFACADEAVLAAEPRLPPPIHLWRSLLGFYGFVRRHSETFPLLFGLVSSLGVVFISRILDISTHHRGEHITRENLLESQALLQRAASDADAKLDLDVLQEQFPKAWSQRARKPLPARERLDPANLDGPFKLPFGVATSPVRAARAGYAILQEWVEKERIGYELKLKL
jgi:hypothetical protein